MMLAQDVSPALSGLDKLFAHLPGCRKDLVDVLTRVARDLTGSDASAQQLLSTIKKSAMPVPARLPFVGRASIIDTCTKQLSSCTLYLTFVIAALLPAAEVCAS